MTIDAWMQHPTPRLQAHPMLESLRRWTGMATLTEALPIELTLAAMDAAGVELGMICAWSSP
ncbi:MAG: amidohydrolase, partial [Myxococcales bacterium]|nr:amidohydrolase [Myxococcales bacterium]